MLDLFGVEFDSAKLLEFARWGVEGVLLREIINIGAIFISVLTIEGDCSTLIFKHLVLTMIKIIWIFMKYL